MHWIAMLLMVLAGFGCASTDEAVPARVGFDLDDTLLYSSPAFRTAFDTDGVEPYSEEFWRIVNNSDEGCSEVKQKARQIMEAHRAAGSEIFVITARHGHGGDVVRTFVEKTFGIPAENVFFETQGKATRIRELGIEIFYGDSDTDIAAAIEAGARAVRILRSPRSTYTRNCNPGKFGEEIVQGSEE